MSTTPSPPIPIPIAIPIAIDLIAMRNPMQFCACFSKNPKRRAAHHQDTANKLPPDFARIGSTPYNPNRKEQWPQTPIRNTAN